MKSIFYIALFFLGSFSIVGQTKVEEDLIVSDTIIKDKINPLAPAKAAFYSAIVPGLGQAYNKKYWKIPLVYGALGSSIYFYVWNNKRYQQFRDEYKSRLAGNAPSPQLSYLDESRLISGQKFYQKNRDLSLLVTVAFYILNIVDANIDAHLMQFNVNDKLSFKPSLQQDELTTKHNLALSLNYSF